MFGLAQDIINGKIPVKNITFKKSDDSIPNEFQINSLFIQLMESKEGDYYFNGIEDFKVFKFVLSTRCAFFYQYFSLPKQPNIDLNSNTLKGFIKWCYNNIFDINIKESLELLNFLQSNWITEPVESLFSHIFKILETNFINNEYQNWELIKEFFLTDSHRRYFTDYFKYLSEIVMNNVLNKQNATFVGDLLPYVLLSLKNQIDVIKEKKVIEKKKKTTKKSISKPIDTDFTVTLLHQEKKPKEPIPLEEKKEEIVISVSAIQSDYPLNKQNIASLNKLILSLTRNKAAFVFMDPVDPVASGALNYFEVIKHPMDLGTVKKKMKDKVYKTVNEVIDDIRLIWANAFTYNSVGSDVWALAKTMSDAFEKKVQTLNFTL